jgi:CBS domain-containing protein
MTSVRDIMSPDIHEIRTDETLVAAARMMAEYDVGALPICDADGKPVGIVTDRDIVVKCVAQGRDPRDALAGEFTQPAIVAVRADDDLDYALQTMQQNQLRRLLVFDGDRFCGVLSQRDIALAASPEEAGRTVEAVSI